MKTPMKRTKATRTGSKVIAVAAAIVLSAPLGFSAKKEKRAPEVFAIVAGTVYRPPGFALQGVSVVVAPEQAEAGSIKLKKSEAITDARGEFAVRVPPVPAKWRVDVNMKGYRPEQKSVSVDGEQRVDLSFVLEPVGKPKETTQ
jgi:hypothetical protein